MVQFQLFLLSDLCIDTASSLGQLKRCSIIAVIKEYNSVNPTLHGFNWLRY